jgi:hypothetical protein
MLRSEAVLHARWRLAILRLPFVYKRVTPVTGSNSAELSRRSRFLAAFVGAGLLATLLLASQLRPDPRGWGTHEQIGLPPCTLLVLTGKRCPACGMTTSWAHFTQGRISDALGASTTGTLLAGIALVVGVTASVVAARGRRVAWQPRETHVAVAALALAGVILFEWAIRLLRG